MLNYSNQSNVTAFDNVALTATYTDNDTIIASGGMSKLTVQIDYARGAAEAASKMQMKLESSSDGVEWYSLVIDETSTVSTITAREWELGGTSKLNVLVDIAYPFMRLSVKESGVVTNAGRATIEYTLSGK